VKLLGKLFFGAESRTWVARLAIIAICTTLVLQPALAQQAQNYKCNRPDLPKLADITAKTGIKFSHDYDPDKRYITESMSGGVVIVDYDRDGWQDIYFTNAPTVAMSLANKGARSELYRNNGDGTFTDVSDKAGVSHPCIAFGGSVGDYNNDNWPDMYVTCLGENVLYRNNGDGTFTDVAKQAGVADPRWSMGSSFGDYDNDGFVDLMVTNYVDFRLNDLPGFGSSPTCKYRGIDVQCGPRGLRGAGDALFHNNGNGTFTEVSKQAGVDDPNGYYGLTTVFVDFDDDNKPDIFVADDATPNFLYHNQGDGKFVEYGMESGVAVSDDGAEQACMGVAIGDYTRTGRASIGVTNFADEYSTLYRNEGGMNFKDVAYASKIAVPSLPWVKWGFFFFDLENDGWLDLFQVGGHVYPQVDSLSSGARYKEPKNLFINKRDGTFCDGSDEAGPALKVLQVGRGAVYADLDNNGSMDIVINNQDGAPTVLKNPADSANHWVGFELQGSKSNRLGIGARVKVYSGNSVQTSWLVSGGSYISQNDMRLHFGLGPATAIEKVEVRWPSGKVDTIQKLKADQFYGLLEGEGVVPLDRIRPKAKTK
jgi:enediyne biosynthesis protein E4